MFLLFNSHIFIFVFLPLVFLGYFFLTSFRFSKTSKVFLIVASLFFYSWANIQYLPLILASLFFNYFISLHVESSKIGASKRRDIFPAKSMLIIGIVGNLSLLGYFKYCDFFIGNFNLVANANLPLLKLALPLSISFFTLQQIAYLVDRYEGLVKDRNLLDYFLFVTFFPHLIAGPIIHYKNLIPQFYAAENHLKNYRNIAVGLFIFSIGLFKKVVIADTFAIWATNGFDVADTLNVLEAWATSLSYTFQLYYDFSGYTDMAIGIALLFNIQLPDNFNSPYKAQSIQDFWRRWHMTLTSFITLYVYTPLAKSVEKLTFEKAMLFTVITFLISGLWHGASWLFVFWGLLHGIGIVINHYWKKTKRKLHPFFAWFLTFNYINATFVIFRAEHFSDAKKVLAGMLGLNDFIAPSEWTINTFKAMLYAVDGGVYTLVALFLAFYITLFCKNSIELKNSFEPTIFHSISLIVLFVTSIFSLEKYSTFVYFQF